MELYYLINLLAFCGFIGGVGVAIAAYRGAAEAWHYGLVAIAAIVAVVSFIRLITAMPF